MLKSELDPFHLAIPVGDLSAARRFYETVLGLPKGREDEAWTDYDLFGHQLVVHHAPGHVGSESSNPVDGHHVPVPHFGVVLSMERWKALAERLESQSVKFVIEPHIRFHGQPGEQATMFFLDPSGNALEFKAFADRSKLFATE
ncbi:MAG: hypothetical protein JWR80_6659 [Bradyrhizobium sp.]|nr:hypothetical protein [Bradyrhizobium sp.]